MPGLLENNGPNYISSHSADVILSESRPIKLRIDALRSINVFLDEFLYNILSTSRSLHTDKLRSSLLSLLPTASGKEALLEAEVEIRAYWERTNPGNHSPPILDDDSKTFSLDWSFEVLRMKCEAYSTLNDSDEDPAAESLLYERMTQAGGIVAPKQALVAPAALYLTAILEAICERILSNVSRVVARDSSRTGATIQDLYTALCEDDSIYGLFKSMKVYEQIESLSKAPKPRRSKSFTRGDRSRAASPHQDISVSKDTAINGAQPPRVSFETTSMPSLTSSTSRASFDKSRAAMKKFRPTRSSSSNDRDGDSQNGHKKSDSLRSVETKGGSNGNSENGEFTFEDAAMLAEFDDLMKSGSTMKVSLTPDRLRTMEVYKQEKDQRSRRPAPLTFKPDSEPTPPPRADGRKPQLHKVDSIVEDEEESPAKLPARSRQTSVSGTNPSTTLPTYNRTRSISNPARSVGTRLIRKSSRRQQPNTPDTPSTPPSSFATPSSSTMPATLVQSRVPGHGQPFGAVGPTRTRKIQRNRESLDLDEVMGGSDDEEEPVFTKSTSTPKPPQTPRLGVSSQTRELMDFLAEGPPVMVDLQGPSNQNGSSISVDKPKGSGRLQKMISKLALGGSDRSRTSTDDFSRSPKSSVAYRVINPKPSTGSLSTLANRPVPPRLPMISPSSSPSSASADEKPGPFAHPRTTSLTQRTQTEQKIVEVSRANGSISHAYGSQSAVNGHAKPLNGEPSPSGSRPNGLMNGTGTTSGEHSSPAITPSTSNGPVTPAKYTRKPVPVTPVATPAGPSLSSEAATNMHRLFANASNADECRVILDMFLARAGIPLPPAPASTGSRPAIVYPTPLSINTKGSPKAEEDNSLEHTVVEMFLNDTKPQYIRQVVEQVKTPDTNDTNTELVVTSPISPPLPTPPVRPSKREAMIALPTNHTHYAPPAHSPVSPHTTSQ